MIAGQTETEGIRRTVGRRTQRPVGIVAPPNAEEIAWREAMAQSRTRVPKGVFRYPTHEAANADWERWHAEAVMAAARDSAGASILIRRA